MVGISEQTSSCGAIGSAVNRKVAGSSPARCDHFFIYLNYNFLYLFHRSPAKSSQLHLHVTYCLCTTSSLHHRDIIELPTSSSCRQRSSFCAMCSWPSTICRLSSCVSLEDPGATSCSSSVSRSFSRRADSSMATFFLSTFMCGVSVMRERDSRRFHHEANVKCKALPECQ